MRSKLEEAEENCPGISDALVESLVQRFRKWVLCWYTGTRNSWFQAIYVTSKFPVRINWSLENILNICPRCPFMFIVMFAFIMLNLLSFNSRYNAAASRAQDVTHWVIIVKSWNLHNFLLQTLPFSYPKLETLTGEDMANLTLDKFYAFACQIRYVSHKSVCLPTKSRLNRYPNGIGKTFCLCIPRYYPENLLIIMYLLTRTCNECYWPRLQDFLSACKDLLSKELSMKTILVQIFS